MSADAALPKRSGLSVLRDVILAPRSAFQALGERTHWGWAYLFICVLGCTGAVLQIPAGEHVAVATFAQNAAHDPRIAAMSSADQQKAIGVATSVQRYLWLFYPALAMLAIAFASLVLLFGTAVARGRAGFARLFGLAANVAILNFGIGYLVVGVLATLRGADAYSSQRDLLLTLPSLAWLVPGGSPQLVTLLAQFNPFQIWSFVLFALGLSVVAKLPRLPAYALAALVTFGGALFAVPMAR